MSRKGFTLIELLVVIAIIGILAGLIVVSLSGADDAAKDARIKSDMAQARSACAIYKTQNGSYATAMCADGTDCDKARDDIVAQGGTTSFYVAASGDTFCIHAVLNDGNTYCIDSNGSVGESGFYCDSVGFCHGMV